MSVIEALLDAWSRCRPRGFSFCVSQLPEALPIIEEVMTPEDRQLKPEEHARIQELLRPKDEMPSPFELMLKSRNGQVQFLYFWRAFGEVWSQVFGREEDELRLRELD